MDHCSFGHHSITVTVERWDEFHMFDGKFNNVRYNPIGKKIEYDWWAFSAPSFMLLEVLNKPFQSFFLHILLFRLTLQGHSQNKTSWHLTDSFCSVCLLISETLRSVLFILRPLYWKNSKTSHESDTAVAGSEFRSPKPNPSCLMPLWSSSLGQHSMPTAVWQSCICCLPKT